MFLLPRTVNRQCQLIQLIFVDCLTSKASLILGKPRGIRTARKLRTHRRDQKWHDKDYKKAHLGTRWKANPFGGASHAKGIVLEKV